MVAVLERHADLELPSPRRNRDRQVALDAPHRRICSSSSTRVPIRTTPVTRHRRYQRRSDAPRATIAPQRPRRKRPVPSRRQAHFLLTNATASTGFRYQRRVWERHPSRSPKGGHGARLSGSRPRGIRLSTKGDGQVPCSTRKAGLNPHSRISPEARRIRRIFHLMKELYRLDRVRGDRREPQQNESNPLPSELAHDTIYLNMRSILQILTFSFEGV